MNRTLSHLSEALRSAFGTARELEAAAECSERSAFRYFNGESVPNVVTLARLIRRSPTFLAAFLEYAGLDERSLAIAAQKLRYDEAALKRDWTANSADMERHLAADEARLRADAAEKPAVPDGSPVSADQQ